MPNLLPILLFISWRLKRSHGVFRTEDGGPAFNVFNSFYCSPGLRSKSSFTGQLKQLLCNAAEASWSAEKLQRRAHWNVTNIGGQLHDTVEKDLPHRKRIMCTVIINDFSTGWTVL